MMTMATAPGDPNYLYEAITTLAYMVEEDPYQDDALISRDHALALLEVLPAMLVAQAKKWSEPPDPKPHLRGL